MAKKLSRPVRRVLVVGGGVAGQRASLDLARVGLEVVLVERGDSLGGTVAQLGAMYPLHNCLLCRGDAVHGPGCTRPTISAELLDRSRARSLTVWTRSRLQSLDGEPGRFRATVIREPRYVKPERCIACDRCAAACPKEMPDPFQAGLTSRRAAYRPSERSVPDAYAIEKGPWCEGCGKCVAACPTDAIDLQEPAVTETLEVGAVVVATGMRLSDAAKSSEYGYGRYANVLTGLEMERMCSPAGPGEGRIARRSDGKAPSRIAWIQCVGSRDEEHDYCSAFCCGYATRQAALARRLLPESEARIFMMDDRVFARGFSATYDPLRAELGIRLDRVRLSVINEDSATRDLVLQLTAPDGKVVEERYGMVVLSVGAEAAAEAASLARTLGIEPDGFGFLRTGTLDPVNTTRAGVFVAGAASGPADVADSVTAAGAAAARVCELLALAPPTPGRAEPDDAAAPMARRIGVFACDCAGDVGHVVDLDALTSEAARAPAVATAATVPFGCLPEGLEAIRSAVASHGLTHVVVGACTARTFAPLFERELGVGVEIVSLREECSLVHRDDPKGATRKAHELVRIGVERARRRAASKETPLRPPPAALVAGGGLAGLTAALHLADAGIPVHLVERERRLGGHALSLGRSADGRDLAEAVEALAARAASHPRITVHLESTVTRHLGFRGTLSAAIRSTGPVAQERFVEVGATVVAVGGSEYRGRAYGLGASDRIVTLLELGGLTRTDPGLHSRPGPVAFVGCVGPWDEPGSAATWRCSRSCCETMMRQARALKEASPGRQVTVLVREVNTYGFREEEYTAARRVGVLFVRFDPREPPVIVEEAGGMRLTVKDQTIGEELAIRAETVVLAAAVLSRPEAQETAVSLGVRLDADGFIQEWEPKTRSVATLEPGVFVCGLAHGPKPAREVVAQALAASQAALVHLHTERALRSDESASIDPKKCASCLTCVRVCPYGVPRLGERGYPQGWPRSKPFIDSYRCQGCGVCVGECPAGAITLDRYGEAEIPARILGRWLPVAAAVRWGAA